MLTALLPDGSVVHANTYDEIKHGFDIYCIDPACKAPVIFVNKGESKTAYFKTTGKSEETRHSPECGFYEPLDFSMAVDKVTLYQEKVVKSVDSTENLKFIRLNLNSNDPDHEKVARGEVERKQPDTTKLVDKEQKDQPDSISSLSSVIKLLTNNDPDILSLVYFTFKGRKVPLSQMIMNTDRAYDALWVHDQNVMKYFVYGKVTHITRRDKVVYIDLESDKAKPFTIVIFQKYLQYFPNIERFEQLMDKDLLVYGQLKKNDYENRNKCEIIITTEKFMATFKKKLRT